MFVDLVMARLLLLGVAGMCLLRSAEGSRNHKKPSVFSGKMISELIENLLSEDNGYNPRIRPGLDSGKPLMVYVNMFVNEISSISEVNMEYSMTAYLRQSWQDERLSFKNNNYNKSITLNYNQFSKIWTPDLFIRNLKRGLFHDITVPNRLIRLAPDGTILYSQRVSLTLSCDMFLEKYPMDNQTCKIDYGSYGYTTEELVLAWKEGSAKPVEVNPTISMPKFALLSVTSEVCTKSYNTTGSYPCIVAYFHLQRRLKSYFLHNYLPSLLVVILSWVSFWIDLDAVPARISLGILTILTITTQSAGVNRNMPSVSLTKAIDVWMATCLVFVFAAFIEYSIVNVLSRKSKERAAREPQPPEEAQQVRGNVADTGFYDSTGAPVHNGKSDGKSVRYRQAAQMLRDPEDPLQQEATALCVEVRYYEPAAEKSCWAEASSNRALMTDVISRILFPLLFLVFNAIYWPMYFN